jgi:hypothetical protein
MNAIKTINLVCLLIFIVSILVLAGCTSSRNNAKQESGLVLCNKSDSGCKAISVDICNYNNSVIYRVNYGCLDIPSQFFDSDFRAIHFCGGMPLPVPEPPQLCDELNKDCQDTNICK